MHACMFWALITLVACDFVSPTKGHTRTARTTTTRGVHIQLPLRGRVLCTGGKTWGWGSCCCVWLQPMQAPRARTGAVNSRQSVSVFAWG